MSDKFASLKEKFRLALTSTAKVISDDFDLINKSSENDKKNLISIEIDNITKPSDFIKLRAETDSSALEKNFLMILFTEKTFHLMLLQDLYII